ncbi:MAG TPA: hypothetical protein GX723_07695 [Thermoanaerobacterales bacterium]|jgi:hypothetical protein|nr:hypothetical protein [Thermoanaerobacterales bacterium]
MVIPQFVIDFIAVRIAEIFFLINGFELIDDWDINGPGCINDYGPHRVYHFCAKIQKGGLFYIDAVDGWLTDYLEYINKALRIIKFHNYRIEIEQCSCCESTYIYMSLST